MDFASVRPTKNITTLYTFNPKIGCRKIIPWCCMFVDSSVTKVWILQSHFGKMQLWEVEHFCLHKKVPVQYTGTFLWRQKCSTSQSCIFPKWLCKIHTLVTLESTNIQHHGIIFLHPILGLNVYNVVMFLVGRTDAEKRTFSQRSVCTVFGKIFDARKIQKACCWWKLREVEVQMFLHIVQICTSNSQNVLRQHAFCILRSSNFFLNTVHTDRCDEVLFFSICS